MRLAGLFPHILTHPKHTRMFRNLMSSKSATSSTTLGGKPILMSALQEELNKPILLITPTSEKAYQVYNQIICYSGNDSNILFLPDLDMPVFEHLTIDSFTNNQRLKALDAITNPSTENPPLIVASLSAVMRKTMSYDKFRASSYQIRVGEKVTISELTSWWSSIGYKNEPLVEIPGSFSRRGGIIDIFPPNSSLPARLDMIGNEIESIHLFEPLTQRSVENIDTIRIIPALEILPIHTDAIRINTALANLNFNNCSLQIKQQIYDEVSELFVAASQENISFYEGLINHSSLIQMTNRDFVIALDEKSDLIIESSTIHERLEQIMHQRITNGELPDGFPVPYISWQEFKESLSNKTILTLSEHESPDDVTGFHQPKSFFGQLNNLTLELKSMRNQDTAVILVTRHSQRTAQILSEADLGSSIKLELDLIPKANSITIVPGSLENGWSLDSENIKLQLLTDSEIFGSLKIPRRIRKQPVINKTFLSQLEIGCYVVHEDHGIARFSGTASMDTTGENREYLVLDYAENDKLYLPTDHLDRITPYIASDDRTPSLTRLSTMEWSRAKERVKSSAQDIAKELLELYANRQLARGHAFSEDTPWQQEVEDAFPFEETPDQIKAIEQIKFEMEQNRPMDRLVCGDVGYGKTEIALRAAFKAVSDGMQVAILVPTTILAQQHYETFSNRLNPYPIKIEVLSRFGKSAQQKKIIDAMKKGTVDIAIGTHRLIQKDVQFKNLGLVIVDEEQRFGVTHKEKLKLMRNQVDVLALSATPIPRTLYMALSGIRDMSTIETPPDERLPIKTFVGQSSESIIREAILRELGRGGQVFFVHNRIRTINRLARQLSELIPEAQIAVAHGRMDEGELESIMMDFNGGRTNVLLCTTIIEAGLDIPNANTLIVDRADQFGLSQLYQLRGRVGRSEVRAYCYLLLPSNQRISPRAEQRLRAILEASELGSGFRLAMRDLEIRGAGNILGAEQSGHISAVGFNMYTRLLNQVLDNLRHNSDELSDKSTLESPEVLVDLPIPAYIPDTYIAHLPNRLDIYQRMTKIENKAMIKDMKNELRDRFGSIPKPVQHLLYIISLRCAAKNAGVKSISQSNNTITINMDKPIGGARFALQKKLDEWANVGNRQIKLNPYILSTDWQKSVLITINRIADFQRWINHLPTKI
ncbi:transcription-repair coupling factor [SAR202 cluster bacterium AC-409-J13_OGT_754m]|nr:transcription-repair coupling factor [SAR202 cluster bacterium AC-409-J13_OGT_754m]